MSGLTRRYVRILRCVWLNPSSAEFQAAAHAFERAHPELAAESNESTTPLLERDELREALRNLSYFASASPEWRRHTKTEAEARLLLGGIE